MRSGVQLGPYAIISRLGAGGMGEVYRATDTRLDRTVAVKILKPEKSQDAKGIQRFQREALAISKVSHPHICALYDVGEQAGVQFIVMEHLEGETLAQRLGRGALPLDQVLRLAIEIAGALAHAHRQGVVHRDLKPANIMLTKAGAKLLDFGIAALQGEIPASRAVDHTLTEEGAILGTFQYMAPEQLEAKHVDARADIFALGAIVYEMATGEPAFKGTSQAGIVAAVLERKPELLLTSPLQGEPAMGGSPGRRQPLPWLLNQIVSRCLAKNPDERFQTASDLEQSLKWVAERRLSGGPPASEGGWRRQRTWRAAWVGIVAVALIAVVIAGVNLARNRLATGSADAGEYRFTVAPPPHSAFSPSSASLALSPDGRMLAFTATSDAGLGLWIQPLDSLEARRLEAGAGAGQIFWSSDSRSIAFAETSKGWRLKTIDLAGEAKLVGDVRIDQVGTWQAKPGILARIGDTINAIPLDGGTPTSVTRLDVSRGETGHSFPSFLPDGRHFVYLARSSRPEHDGTVYLMEVGSRTPTALFSSDSQVVYAAPGYLLYMVGNTLLARGFDTVSLRVTGEAIPIAEQVERNTGSRRGAFTVSQTGVLAYRRPSESQLVWFHRDGRKLNKIGAPGHFRNPALSPDGTRVSVSQLDLKTGTWDIWVMEVATGRMSRVTLDEADDDAPVWSADGRRIAFKSDREGEVRFYWKAAGSTGPDVLLHKPTIPGRTGLGSSRTLYGWLNDGTLLYGASTDTTILDMWRTTVGTNDSATPVVATPFIEGFGALSRDNRWLAYASNESGRFEVYATPYPSAQAKWLISAGGGLQPAWRGDGKELFYLAPKGQLMAVSVKTGPSLEVEEPQRLFETGVSTFGNPNYNRNHYAVTSDGQRFLIAQPAATSSAASVTVIVGWTASIKGRPGS